jgi:hypothetical protein
MSHTSALRSTRTMPTLNTIGGAAGAAMLLGFAVCPPAGLAAAALLTACAAAQIARGAA